MNGTSRGETMPLFTTTNYPINALIEGIDLGKIGLPELQPRTTPRDQDRWRLSSPSYSSGAGFGLWPGFGRAGSLRVFHRG
jgi:hypothetical protein